MNYSYANKVLKAELQDFLDGLCKDAKRPVAKLFFDLVYGLMRSGSSLVSLIVRSSCPGEKPGMAEHRITQAIAPSLTGMGLVLIGATTPLLLPVPKKRLLYLRLLNKIFVHPWP